MDVEWYGVISTLLFVTTAVTIGYLAAAKAVRLEAAGGSAVQVERYIGRYVMLWPLLVSLGALLLHVILFWLINGGEPRPTEMLLNLIFCRSRAMADRWIGSGTYIGRSLIYVGLAFSGTCYATLHCLRRKMKPNGRIP